MKKKILLSLAITVVLVFILVRVTSIELGDVTSTLRKISLSTLGLAFILHLSIYLLRTFRFRILIRSRRVPFMPMFDIVAFHNLSNYVLPFRTGELSYVILLSKAGRFPVGEGVGTLLVSRIFDFVALSLIYPVSIVSLALGGVHASRLTLALFGLGATMFLTGIAVLALLVIRAESLGTIAERLIGFFRLDRFRFSASLKEKVGELIVSFRAMRSKKVLAGSFAISIVILLISFLFGYVLMRGMGIRMSYLQIVFCSTLSLLANGLPINTLAGIGTMEAMWLAGCVLAGIDQSVITDAGYSSLQEMAMSSGFSLHIIVLLFIGVIGLYGIVRLKGLGRRFHAVRDN
ncbi:lysylphosphatidylglycerol synthase transmembrane domain-containing protein [Thermodesulfobacteriota bacterium]